MVVLGGKKFETEIKIEGDSEIKLLCRRSCGLSRFFATSSKFFCFVCLFALFFHISSVDFFVDKIVAGRLFFGLFTTPCPIVTIAIIIVIVIVIIIVNTILILNVIIIVIVD